MCRIFTLIFICVIRAQAQLPNDTIRRLHRPPPKKDYIKDLKKNCYVGASLWAQFGNNVSFINFLPNVGYKLSEKKSVIHHS